MVEVAHTVAQKGASAGAPSAVALPPKQLSQFSTKVKDILSKINEAIRVAGISARQLFDRVDLNKNGVVEKAEF